MYMCTFGLDTLTIVANLIDDLKLDDGGLLEKSATDILLHGELDLDAL